MGDKFSIMAKQPSGKTTMAQLKAENAKLKAQNKKLAAQAASKKSSGSLTKTFWRRLAVGILVFFAVVLLTVGNIAFWTGNTLVKQDRFVAATSPIIKDENVQKALALYTTNQIFANVDVEKITQEALPPRAQFLAPQLTSQLKTQTNSLLEKAISSERFVNKWNSVSAKWHNRVITFATNYKGDGRININDAYTQASSELSSTKLSFLANKQLPAKIGNITIINAESLPTVHRVITKIDTWRILAILLLVISLVGAVLLSKGRRRTLYLFSFGSAAAMALSLIALNAGTENIAGRADPQYVDGVRSALQILTHSLSVQTLTIMCAALLIGFIAWISGQSKSASAIKNQGVYVLTGRIHESLFGSSTSGIVRWFQHYKRQVQWSIVIILSALMLAVRLTPKSLAVYTSLILVLVLIVEALGSTPEKK